MNSLPQLGDNPDLKLSPTNPAGFAHIGAEIKLKDHPIPSQFSGSLFDRNTLVKITSSFSVEKVQQQRKELHEQQPTLWLKETLGVWAEKIPLIGRLIAHAPGQLGPVSDVLRRLIQPIAVFGYSVILGSVESCVTWRLCVDQRILRSTRGGDDLLESLPIFFFAFIIFF